MTYNDWRQLKWAVDQAEAWQGSIPAFTPDRERYEKEIEKCRKILEELRRSV